MFLLAMMLLFKNVYRICWAKTVNSYVQAVRYSFTSTYILERSSFCNHLENEISSGAKQDEPQQPHQQTRKRNDNDANIIHEAEHVPTICTVANNFQSKLEPPTCNKGAQRGPKECVYKNVCIHMCIYVSILCFAKSFTSMGRRGQNNDCNRCSND